MKVLHSATEAAQHTAALIHSLVDEKIARTGHCTLAVPGGGTPLPVFRLLRARWLANEELQCHLSLTVVDERYLPVDSTDWRTWPPQSNSAQLIRELGQYLPKATCIPWTRPGSLEDCQHVLEAVLPDPDVVLLGMGPDGHIASLFPPLKRESVTSSIQIIQESPKPPSQRLSVSLSWLNRAAHAVILVTGESKADALSRVISGDPSLPLSKLTTPTLHWFVDRTSASKLYPTDS